MATDVRASSGSHASHEAAEASSPVGFDPAQGAYYLDRVIAGFEADPADSDFQDGYMAALHTMKAESGYCLVHEALAEFVAATEAFTGNHGKAPTKRIDNAVKAGRFALTRALGQ